MEFIASMKEKFWEKSNDYLDSSFQNNQIQKKQFAHKILNNVVEIKFKALEYSHSIIIISQV